LDDKIKRLIYEHGFLGYGIYWALVEDLYNNANALRKDYNRIADDYKVQSNVIISIITEFDLFIFDDNFFYSTSVEKRLNERMSKSTKARESANYRWKNEDDANALRQKTKRNTIKERKGKEIKGNILLKGKKFIESDFNDLPEQYIVATKEQIKIQRQQSIDSDEIISMWKVFKIQNLTGENYYNSENEVYKHFSNWIKNQKFTKNAKPINEERFNARVEYANRWNNSDIEIKKDN
jgi:hypothetical protein